MKPVPEFLLAHNFVAAAEELQEWNETIFLINLKYVVGGPRVATTKVIADDMKQNTILTAMIFGYELHRRVSAVRVLGKVG